MPAQHERPTRALRKPPRIQPLPEPGIGGYDYPRGPYGATGFPGSTPAALARGNTGHRQTAEGRKDRQLSVTEAWDRDTGPEFDDAQWDVPKPQPSYSEVEFRPGTQAQPGNRFIRRNGTPRQPYARQMRSTSPEHREIPDIGGAPGSQNVRNTIAQRYKALPELVRGYRPAPNPGKTGARLAGPSQYHPNTTVYGDPEGGPIPGMAYNPDGTPPQVFVQSRFVEHEGGSQEGYAMNRRLFFAKGGTPAPIPHGAAPHIRGGRYDGTRYFGALADQQMAHGAGEGSYGIVRARGPRHRPVRFEPPTPWAASYYDVPPEKDEAIDRIHRSPAVRDPRHENRQTPRQGRSRTPRRG